MDIVSCAALAVVQGSLAERFRFLGPAGSPLQTTVLLFALQYIALKVYRVFLYHRYFSPLRHVPGPTVSCSHGTLLASPRGSPVVFFDGPVR
jgi:hypothetical protein